MRLALAILFFLGAHASEAQTIEASYSSFGMGSNRGKPIPTFKIDEGKFVYTNEPGVSWFGEKMQETADTITTGLVVPECLEGLEQLMSELGDTTIHEWNMGIMSGRIVNLNVIKGQDTINISLHNSWHSQAKRIVDLLNLNLPEDEHLGLADEKWGSEYAEMRVLQLMDSLRLCPSEQIVGYLKEYRSFHFHTLVNTAYHEFAFDYVFAFYERFFLTLNGIEEGHVKDWISIAAIGLKKNVELRKNPEGEIQKLSENFAGRIQELPEIKRDFALQFWNEMVKKVASFQKMSE